MEYFSDDNNLQGVLELPVSSGDLEVYNMSLLFGVLGTFTLMQQQRVAFVACFALTHTLSLW